MTLEDIKRNNITVMYNGKFKACHDSLYKISKVIDNNICNLEIINPDGKGYAEIEYVYKDDIEIYNKTN